MAAPKGNKNAEKWTFEEAEELFLKLLEIAEDTTNPDNDFIGEIAQQCKTNLSILDYLTTKYPDLETIYNQIKSNCEANCFRNGKKGNIVPSLAIMNLKSNHGWTDRVVSDLQSKGEKIGYTPLSFFNSDDKDK
jgi:hypothetical protein